MEFLLLLSGLKVRLLGMDTIECTLGLFSSRFLDLVYCLMICCGRVDCKCIVWQVFWRILIHFSVYTLNWYQHRWFLLHWPRTLWRQMDISGWSMLLGIVALSVSLRIAVLVYSNWSLRVELNFWHWGRSDHIMRSICKGYRRIRSMSIQMCYARIHLWSTIRNNLRCKIIYRLRS